MQHVSASFSCRRDGTRVSLLEAETLLWTLPYDVQTNLSSLGFETGLNSFTLGMKNSRDTNSSFVCSFVEMTDFDRSPMRREKHFLCENKSFSQFPIGVLQEDQKDCVEERIRIFDTSHKFRFLQISTKEALYIRVQQDGAFKRKAAEVKQ